MAVVRCPKTFNSRKERIEFCGGDVFGICKHMMEHVIGESCFGSGVCPDCKPIIKEVELEDLEDFIEEEEMEL